jgi:hypothetical protein
LRFRHNSQTRSVHDVEELLRFALDNATTGFELRMLGTYPMMQND